MEYYHGNEEVSPGQESRMHEIAKFILNNFSKSTFDGEFDALFAVQNVPMLIRYYKIFKELNPKSQSVQSSPIHLTLTRTMN